MKSGPIILSLIASLGMISKLMMLLIVSYILEILAGNLTINNCSPIMIYIVLKTFQSIDKAPLKKSYNANDVNS